MLNVPNFREFAKTSRNLFGTLKYIVKEKICLKFITDDTEVSSDDFDGKNSNEETYKRFFFLKTIRRAF